MFFIFFPPDDVIRGRKFNRSLVRFQWHKTFFLRPWFKKPKELEHFSPPNLSSPSLIFASKIWSLCYKLLRDVTYGCTKAGNAKGGRITVPLTSCWTGLDKSVLQIKTKIVGCHTADSKPVKQEVNSTVILPPLVFPDQSKLPCQTAHCTTAYVHWTPQLILLEYNLRP
jgi:hypothetical protein